MSPGVSHNDYAVNLKGAPTPSDMKTVLNTFDGSHQSKDLTSQANRADGITSNIDSV